MIKGNLPTISVVMPVYNCVDYIERAIRSVITQKYPNLELYIKDGGSRDGTVEIIKSYADKFSGIIKWESSKDKGQTDAINVGMRKVKGEILTYLNGDDVYKSNAFGQVGKFFLNHEDAMWAYGECDIIDGDDKVIRGWITAYKNIFASNYSYLTLLILNYVSQMGVFWRREAYEVVGEFDVNQHYVMDYDYWLRLGEKYKAGFINEYLASFRIVPTTKSSTGFVKQFEDEYQVAKMHTKNDLILFLHRIHYRVIIFVYSLLRFYNILKARLT